jgi:hypothetical protein
LNPPLALTESNRLSMALPNGSRIISLPATEGTIRGYSAVDLVIEDEASRVPDELYFAIRPMLAISGGSLILMSTPAGKVGHFYREWEEGGEEWKRIRIAGEQCPRISKAFLASELESFGDEYFAQEYQNAFIAMEGQLFRESDIERATSASVPQDDLQGLTWETA